MVLAIQGERQGEYQAVAADVPPAEVCEVDRQAERDEDDDLGEARHRGEEVLGSRLRRRSPGCPQAARR